MTTKRNLIPQDAMTKSDKQYCRNLGIDPDGITIYDLQERLTLMSENTKWTSRAQIQEHFDVTVRVIRICRDTALRANAKGAAAGKAHKLDRAA
jgi:hypothetical protein